MKGQNLERSDQGRKKAKNLHPRQDYDANVGTDAYCDEIQLMKCAEMPGKRQKRAAPTSGVRKGASNRGGTLLNQALTFLVLRA